MKKYILLIFWFLSTSVFAQNVEWAQTLGGSGRDQPQSIKSDIDGNVYVAGTFVGTPIEFSDSDIALHGSDSTDIYLYKKSPAGQLLWATALSSEGHEHVNDITVDNAGNVYIAGWFRKPMTLGTPDINQITLTSSAGQDGFIAKYDPNGQLLMAYPVGGIYKDEIHTLSMDADNNVVLSGRFMGEIDFDFSETTQIFASSGLTFVKLTTDLELISVFNVNSNKVYPSNVEYTATGEMIFAGTYTSAFNLPTGGGVESSVTSGDCGFVMKVDANNEFLWSVAIQGNISQAVTDIHVTQAGETYITGHFTENVSFRANPSYHIYQSDSNSRDIFFAKLSDAGDFEWIKIIGGSLFDEATGIEVDTDGNIILTGRYSGAIDIDPSLATVHLVAQGNSATFIAKYTPNGQYITAYSFQNSSYNVGSGIALSPTNEIYVAGWFTEFINFDLSQTGLSFYSNGVQDTYLVKLGAITVGLTDEQHTPEISLFPNPASDRVSILAEQLEKIECFDMHGKLVLSYSPSFRKKEHTLSISHLPAGIYFIRVSAKDQPPFTAKLIRIN